MFVRPDGEPGLTAEDLRGDLVLYWLLIGLLFAFAADALWNLWRGPH